MLNRSIIIVSTIILLCFAAESAEIRLFLQPKVMTEGNNLLLSDIASIEGNCSNIEQIKNISIEREIFSDGYIDKKEITSLLKKYNEDNFIVYGNAVHVITNLQTDITSSEQNDLILKKGDRVEIILNNKGVSLILKGIVVNEGRINEEITVRIENKLALTKVLKAKVIGKDLVEVNI
jgi:hypothetical protein